MFFHCQMVVDLIKMLQYLESIIVLVYIMIKEKKGILTFGKGITDCLLDDTIPEEAQYSNTSTEWQQQKFPEFELQWT